MLLHPPGYCQLWELWSLSVVNLHEVLQIFYMGSQGQD
jgi:hypothetical protein